MVWFLSCVTQSFPIDNPGQSELRDGNLFQGTAFLLWHPERLVESAENKGPGTWSWTFQSSYSWKGPLSCYRGHCDHCSILLQLPLAPALFPCLNVLPHFPLGVEGKHEYIYFWVSWKERWETPYFKICVPLCVLTNLSSSFLIFTIASTWLW